MVMVVLILVVMLIGGDCADGHCGTITGMMILVIEGLLVVICLLMVLLIVDIECDVLIKMLKQVVKVMTLGNGEHEGV